MTALLSPVPNGTDVAEVLGGKAHSRSLFFDAAGVDAMGLVSASPAANTFLGRLKAIQDLLNTQAGFVDGIEALIGSTNTALGTLNGYSDGVEGLLSDVKALLTTQAAYVDGLEALIGSTNSAIATLITHNDGVEGLLGTNNTATSLTTPADDVFTITPNDSADLATIPKALLCTAAGNVALRGTSGTTVTIAVAAGQILPIRARRVMATNTSATVVGLV